jgi:uncharacterized protein
MQSRTNRRTFLRTAIGTSVAASVARALPSWQARDLGAIAIQTPLTTFSYADVELFDGPMKRQFEENHSRFLTLDDDRMLKVFRQAAGMPAPGEDMGGWYDLTGFDLEHHKFQGFAPGHSFGQYVSALARAYAITKSEPTRAKVNRLVKAYGETLDPQAKFFVNHRFPAYTYDKLTCGLIDAHEFAGSPEAMEIHGRLTKAIVAYLPERALSRQEQEARPHKDVTYTWDETYTLPENLFLAYQRSGKSLYRDMATRFLEDDTYFGPLADGKNVLPTEHAYSHVNALSSAMQAYITLGSEKHFRAAKNAFEMITTAQSFATGGWGPGETFVQPGQGQLGDSLRHTHAGFETPCGAYAHFKITRYLMRVTKDSAYGDSMERVLYNTILGAWPIQSDGTSFYYSDYAQSGKKVWFGEKWPCCSGTFPQLAADYHISTYLRSSDGLYINLFAPSRVRWNDEAGHYALTQETKYPFENTVRIRVSASQPKEYALYVRIPGWADEGAILAVNGKRVSDSIQNGRFVAIRRTWQDGDRLELELPMKLRLESVDPTHPNVVALMRGPLVLFAVSESQPTFSREELLRAKPTNNAQGDWLARSVDGSNVAMRPFMNINKESYSTYVLLKT